MKKTTSIILIVIAVLILGGMFLVAIGLMIYGFSTMDNTDNTFTSSAATTTANTNTVANNARLSGKVFTSNDGLFQLTASPSWQVEYDLNDGADVQMSNSADEEYVIVFDEPTTDFADDATLEDYYELVSEDFSASINEAVIGVVKDIYINTYPAKQVEVSGVTESKVKISYIITVVETPGYFHQIWAWTTTGNYPTVKADLLNLTNTFTETSVADVDDTY